jgi:hypothetical protein
MKIRGMILLCAGLFAASTTSASATMYISEDRGGQIGQYLHNFAAVRSSGERVVVDGNCLSACTLLLGVIPHNRICATPRARFGFHAAWMPDSAGRPVTSRMGTQALWRVYPSSVRRWINRHGGLSRRMIYLQGRELAGIVPSCGAATRSASNHTSRRLPSRRTAQYERIGATSFGY